MAAISLQGKRKARSKWPCGICGKECRTNAIQCGTCISWFHRRCEKLTPDQLSSFGDVTLDYTCRGCSKSFGLISPELSLERLSKNSSSFKNLVAAVDRETILMREVPYLSDMAARFVKMNATLVPDKPSMQLLKSSGGCGGRIPVSTSGDGNCLFNAISIAIKGNESLSAEIRLRTCLEMVGQAEKYTAMHANTGIGLVSPNYKEACQSCSRNSGYSSAWTMQAASSVIGAPIISVYPPVNGMMDLCVRILNTTFTPLTTRTTVPLYIMWTSTSHASEGTWTPNHFVPLLRNSGVTQPPPSQSSGRKTYAQCVASPPIHQASSIPTPQTRIASPPPPSADSPPSPAALVVDSSPERVCTPPPPSRYASSIPTRQTRIASPPPPSADSPPSPAALWVDSSPERVCTPPPPSQSWSPSPTPSSPGSEQFSLSPSPPAASSTPWDANEPGHSDEELESRARTDGQNNDPPLL